ncbi:hypothetical protein OCU04_010360 [Sclerotinia nivalis]|uniref:RING-type domain-containing protein n=1 Tax=Sclerotinia nivalis TaxID=352851 RepID=A0A9X0AEK1_9HELO|nr:hypothetical protein OCU04_010360 [Sclerotinia nivalis]
MSLLDRIRENFKARAERKRQATDEINNPENEDTSSENVAKQNPALLDEATSSEVRTSEENVTSYTTRRSTQRTSNVNSRVTEESSASTSTSTSTTTNHRALSTRPLQATTRRGPALHNDLSEDHDNEDDNDDDSSTASLFPVSRSHGHSNNMSSRPSIIRHSSRQTNGLHRQSMNNRRRNNNRFSPDNNNNLSVEHHDNFGAPLERVDARQPHPSLSTGMQDQVGNQMGGNSEQPHSGSDAENPDFEDTWANNDRLTNYLAPLLGLPQAPIPYPQQLRTVPIFHPQFSPSQHPHRQARVHHAIIFNQVPDNLDFEDIAWDTAIERALIPTVDTERDSCVICEDPYDVGEHRPVKVPGCVHVFGELCIKRWLKENHDKMTCPICRNFVDIPAVRLA